jgi:transposase
MARGYRTNLWTQSRIAQLIDEEFGVPYHRHHIGRLMHGFHWSHQKPERCAIEQDEQDIERWKRQAWPRIKNKPLGWAPP